MENKLHFDNPPLNIIIAVIFFLSLSALHGQIAKVDLFSYMVTNESGDGDATLMVDEQELAGDPLHGDDFSPETKWSTSFGEDYPMGAYIDFGHELELRHVFIYDYNSIGDLIVEFGEPGNWQYLFTEPLDKYKRWKQHDVLVNTRYLRFVKTHASPKFSEVVVYADNPVFAPPAISNLAISNYTPLSVDLAWNDVLPNEATGAFTSYDLRYNTQPVTDLNFDNCLPYQLQIVPDGQNHRNVMISGLEANTEYYFALKAVGENGATVMSNVVSARTTIFFNEILEKVFLDPSMIVNESGLDDATLIVDEQEAAGDPLAGSGNKVTNKWSPGSSSSYYPASAYLDLGYARYIDHIFIYDVNSVGDLIVEYGTPGEWNYLFTEPCNTYMKWKQHDVNIHARYVRFTMTGAGAKFSEVVIYCKAPLLVEEKLQLNPTMITNRSGYGDVTTLVDEQEIAGDPANSPGGNPVTYWQTGFQASIPYPLYALLDLGKPYEVTKLFLRDTYDVSIFNIYFGSGDNWQLVATDNLGGYLSWNQHDINQFTRFIKFEKTSPSANVAEVVIYGKDHSAGFIDTIPPAAITDLVCVYDENEPDQVRLQFTAPGGDHFQGTADRYDVRYSPTGINQENFYQALSWDQLPAPASAGTPQEITITGLNPGTDYYFSMIAIDKNFNSSPLSNQVTVTTGFEIGGDPFRLILTPDMVLNEFVQGNAGFLVDEQAGAGDPLSGNGNETFTWWDAGTTTWKYPVYAIIDLKGLCNITEVFVYDLDESDPITVYTGEPFDWQEAFVDSLTNINQWNHHLVNTESRYLRLKLNSRKSKIGEIVVYASRLEALEEEPEPLSHQFALMDELIGINAFVNDPPGRMAAAGFVREYHNWMWCEGNTSQSYPGYPNNQNEFNTMGWNFDYYYKNFAKSGIVAAPCIQDNVMWLTDFNLSKKSTKPVSPGEDPEDPFSYREHADHLFQYAARYGNVAVDQSLLKLASNQDVVTGTNWLKYYESWNEQDKWWKGRDSFFTPYEYAAMASADYDGHKGALGNTYGVKNADPDAKLVMGGLAKPDLNYVKAMKLWADYHRDGEAPFDVINVHHYCNDGYTQSSGNVGISPEEDNLKELMKEFVEYRNKYLPGKEVWITEFGYDTHPQSVQRAPAIGSFSQEEVQAQWLVRSYLELAAAGVDKAAMYMLRDVDPNSSTKFNNSGLISSMATGWIPKASWYYVYTMRNMLTGMRFHQEIESGNPNVFVYKFQNDDASLAAYAVWCPTGNQTTVEDYQLEILPIETTAMLVELEKGSIVGNQQPLTITGDKVTIQVSERPVFVMVSSGGSFPEPKQTVKLTLDTSMVVNESGDGDPTTMVDEQEISGDPYFGVYGEPVNKWSTTSGADYPVHAYVDLGQEFDVEVVYLRDMNATGLLSISIGEPGNWTEVAQDNCGRYKVWSNHHIGQTTRYVRISKHERYAEFSEIVIYVNE
jgi:hypothetical protein